MEERPLSRLVFSKKSLSILRLLQIVKEWWKRQGQRLIVIVTDQRRDLFFIIFFIFNCKVLTYNTYLQTMYDTYATNRNYTLLTKKTYLQCEILALLTILYSTYNTKLAILTYNEMLTLLKVLYSSLYIYKTATCTTYITDYIRYKLT